MPHGRLYAERTEDGIEAGGPGGGRCARQAVGIFFAVSVRIFLRKGIDGFLELIQRLRSLRDAYFIQPILAPEHP
ncbi:hypothetical protein D3C75_1141620 [compost metagenome]